MARVEYTVVPGTNSNFEYNRKRVLFNYPFKVKEGTYFFAGVDYSHIHMEFTEEVDSFNKEETDNFTLFDLNLTYSFPIKNDWRIGLQVTPGLSSNMESSLEWDDMVISSVVAFIKDKKDQPDGKKPYRIIIGAAYSGSSGVPFPIPFISFYKKFRPRWSYNLGAPVSNLQWHTSNQVRMKLFATLDGFNSNLHRNQVVNDNQETNRLRVNMILLGTRYEFKFSEHIESFVTITRSFNPVVQLRRNRMDVLTLSTEDVMHYRIGIRCKI
ncbi:MAG: hypothetical protein Tsb0034_01220 [Ekhidna sp.]